MKTYSVVIRNFLEDLIVKVYLIKCNDIKEALLRVCPSLFDNNNKKINIVVNVVKDNIKVYSDIKDIKGDEYSLSFVYEKTYSEIYFKDKIEYEYFDEAKYMFNFNIKEITDDMIDKLKNNYDKLIKDEDKFKLILLHLYELEYINL